MIRYQGPEIGNRREGQKDGARTVLRWCEFARAALPFPRARKFAAGGRSVSSVPGLTLHRSFGESAAWKRLSENSYINTYFLLKRYEEARRPLDDAPIASAAIRVGHLSQLLVRREDERLSVAIPGRCRSVLARIFGFPTEYHRKEQRHPVSVSQLRC